MSLAIGEWFNGNLVQCGKHHRDLHLESTMASYLQEPEDVQMEDSFAGGGGGESSTSKPSKKAIISVVIDEAHPFDLDAYISNYDREPAFSFEDTSD
jgi:hypothetical protein